jgi:hypothetical protein
MIEPYCTVIQGLFGIKIKLESQLICRLDGNRFIIQNFYEVFHYTLIEIAFKATLHDIDTPQDNIFIKIYSDLSMNNLIATNSNLFPFILPPISGTRKYPNLV